MIQAAKFIGTDPWVLEEQEQRWFDYAQIMSIAESRAQGATYTVHNF